jgi:hypothetical protein
VEAPETAAAKYAELGLDYKTASIAQQLADLPANTEPQHKKTTGVQ